METLFMDSAKGTVSDKHDILTSMLFCHHATRFQKTDCTERLVMQQQQQSYQGVQLLLSYNINV